MKTNNMEQRSDEWFDIRKLRLTASNAQCIATAGKGLETYIYQIIAENFASEIENYTNADMERGVELEDQARIIYELEKGVEVQQVGFIELGKNFGCSPDGLIGEDGGLEIKCVNNANFVKAKVKQDYDKKYYWQCMMSLYITQREWWDLAIYNQAFKESLLVFRIEPNEKDFKKLEAGLEKGKEMLIKSLSAFQKGV